MLFRSLTLLLALVCFGGCVAIDDTYPQVPPGPWRAELKLEARPVTPNPKGKPLPEKLNFEFEEVAGGVLPFTFEVAYENDSTFYIDMFNGEETIRIPASNIGFGRDKTIARDTLRIDFPVYDSYISAYHEDGVIEGVWVKNYDSENRIPFVAKFGQNHRFTHLRKAPEADLTGAWAVNFGKPGEDPYPGIAEFKQDGNTLLGTFRTETGDFRYLAGTMQGRRAYLSVFDGSHAFLFEAELTAGDTLRGTFRSGRSYITGWTAVRSSSATLTDPDALTRLNEDAPLQFSFPGPGGKMVSLTDPAFAGKVKLVQVMGTWCPNCRDETTFLQQYLSENPNPDLAVIGLAFERYADPEKSLGIISRYRSQLAVPWPILLAGTSSDKVEAGRKLPMLSQVISYPTLLFVDRQNRVRRIHTGFNGPATSKYEEFVISFEKTVNELLAEQEIQ